MRFVQIQFNIFSRQSERNIMKHFLSLKELCRIGGVKEGNLITKDRGI